MLALRVGQAENLKLLKSERGRLAGHQRLSLPRFRVLIGQQSMPERKAASACQCDVKFA
jgi:hypothetical protein